MTAQPKRQHIKEGDIVAIPLTDGKYAFGREFKHGFGVYDFIGKSASDIPVGINRFLFIVGVYRDVLTSGVWLKVGDDLSIPNNSPLYHRGFIMDAMDGSYELYDHATGETKSSSRQECEGLECVAAWDAEHVIERILAARQGKVSEQLKNDPWVPDILEIGLDGQISRRIKFKDWVTSR